jgi:hypothetical protein
MFVINACFGLDRERAEGVAGGQFPFFCKQVRKKKRPSNQKTYLF